MNAYSILPINLYSFSFVGLYYISYALLKLTSLILNTSLQTICTTNTLRSINTLFGIGIFFCFKSIITSLTNPLIEKNTISKALLLTLLPTHYFFNFLYYTDAGSNFFVLLAFALALKQRYTSSAIVSRIAKCMYNRIGRMDCIIISTN